MGFRRVKQKLIVLGASAYPEVGEIIKDINAVKSTYEVVGLLDDNPALHGQHILDVPVLGALDMVEGMTEVRFVLAIGSHRTRLVRHQIVERLRLPRESYATLIHPNARIFSTSSLGHGCILHGGAVVLNQSRLEDLVLVLANTVIGPNNHICEGAMIASLVSTTTDVKIGHYAHVGTGALIAEGAKIGCGAQIGMGTLVHGSVPPGAFCLGNPKRIKETVEVPQALRDRWSAIVD